MTALEFEPTTHTYRLDGNVVPGVTESIGRAFPIWYSDEVALRRGIAVHRLTECHDRGIEFDGTPDELAVATPYLDQWLRFLDETDADIDPEWIEQPVCHPDYGYAGTLDRVAMLNGDRVVLDIKTGAYHANHRLQAAAYFFASGDVHHSVGVYLRPTGYTLRTWDDAFDDFRVFLATLTVASWADEMKVQTQVPETAWEPPANNEAFVTW